MEDIYTLLPSDEFKHEHGDSESNSVNESLQESASSKLLGMSWGDLSKSKFTNTEKIIFGLSRGNVGTMFAVTNLGKTTFTLNLALTLAAGRTFSPFVKNTPLEGRRILLVDGESTQAELKADLEVMMSHFSDEEKALVKHNLHIVCDEEIGNEPLNLANSEHIAELRELASDFKPDLIIVDTLSALFTLKNENDNAEISKVVMHPLKKLGKDANAVVWLLHHVGKQNEDGKASVGAYIGRGGSNIGALSRVVTVLKQDAHDHDRVIFSLPKGKGYHLEPILMSLNKETRWFETTNEVVPQVQTSYQILVSTVNSFGHEVKRKEVVEALDGIMSSSSVTRHLAEAVARKDLVSHKPGYYAPSDKFMADYVEASEIM